QRRAVDGVSPGGDVGQLVPQYCSQATDGEPVACGRTEHDPLSGGAARVRVDRVGDRDRGDPVAVVAVTDLLGELVVGCGDEQEAPAGPVGSPDLIDGGDGRLHLAGDRVDQLLVVGVTDHQGPTA